MRFLRVLNFGNDFHKCEIVCFTALDFNSLALREKGNRPICPFQVSKTKPITMIYLPFAQLVPYFP